MKCVHFYTRKLGEMIKNDEQYRYLVVGDTGMLAPLCQSLKSQDVIIAARFLSRLDQLEVLQKIICVCRWIIIVRLRRHNF